MLVCQCCDNVILIAHAAIVGPPAQVFRYWGPPFSIHLSLFLCVPLLQCAKEASQSSQPIPVKEDAKRKRNKGERKQEKKRDRRESSKAARQSTEDGTSFMSIHPTTIISASENGAKVVRLLQLRQRLPRAGRTSVLVRDGFAVSVMNVNISFPINPFAKRADKTHT